jgi:regulator of protease activity HflC (stomatin/prohibitin superfamily)
MNAGAVIGITLGCIAVILGLFFGLPLWNVWSEGLGGQAELARAQQNRQIRIEKAKSLSAAAVFEAEAEVARARGVAEANEIIAEGLGGPEGYLRWRFIEMLQETGGDGRETIYIPTEAGIPILEAGRFGVQ